MQLKTFKSPSPLYDKALELRTEILRKPIGLKFTQEELEQDKKDMHFGLFDDEKILACLTLSPKENKRMKIRQVAVDKSMQGRGLGKEITIAAEKYARKNKFELVFCHARKTAVPFYQKLGYTIAGNEFKEVTLPHYVMEKPLK